MIKIKSRVAVHDGVARRRRDFTPVSNRAQPRAGKGNTGWGWLLPRGKSFGPLNSGKDRARGRDGGGGAATTRRRNSECSQRESEGGGSELKCVPSHGRRGKTH